MAKSDNKVISNLQTCSDERFNVIHLENDAFDTRFKVNKEYRFIDNVQLRPGFISNFSLEIL